MSIWPKSVDLNGNNISVFATHRDWKTCSFCSGSTNASNWISVRQCCPWLLRVNFSDNYTTFMITTLWVARPASLKITQRLLLLRVVHDCYASTYLKFNRRLWLLRFDFSENWSALMIATLLVARLASLKITQRLWLLRLVHDCYASTSLKITRCLWLLRLVHDYYASSRATSHSGK